MRSHLSVGDALPVKRVPPRAMLRATIQCCGEWLSVAQAPSKRAQRQTHAPRPIGQGFSDPIQCQQSVSGHVARLLCLRCPAAVVWLVVAIIVATINRIAHRRAWSHVCQERLERVEPALAHSDSASAVVLKSVCLRISATLKHLLPNAVFTTGTRLAMCAARHPLILAPILSSAAVQLSGTITYVSSP